MEDKNKNTNIAIVVEVNKGFCLLFQKEKEKLIKARLKSSLYKKNEKVICGDIVSFEWIEEHLEIDALILSINKRKNIVKRPQIVNVDSLFLVISISKPHFSYQFLAKALMYLQMNNITPEIILTKIDLSEDYKKVKMNLELEDYKVHTIKNGIPTNTLDIQKEGVSVFIGRSGVGKTTIINHILGTDFKTQETSEKLKRGKHTTTSVKGMSFNDGVVFDTPGFETIQFEKITRREVAKVFFNSIFLEKLKCPYTSCDHLEQSGCNLESLCKENKVSKERIETYKQTLLSSSTTKW